MKGIQIARQVVAEKACHVFRPRVGVPGEYDAKPYFTGNHRGWTALDLFTASAIVQVHDKLNDQNRAHFAAMPLPRMAQVAMRLVQGREI